MRAAMLIVAGLLASVPLAAQQPYAFPPRQHPTDAAMDDVSRRFLQSQRDMDRLRRETWQDQQRQQDQRTPKGLRPEGLHPHPQTGPRSAP